jgi:hypothetical protein
MTAAADDIARPSVLTGEELQPGTPPALAGVPPSGGTAEIDAGDGWGAGMIDHGTGPSGKRISLSGGRGLG